MTAIRECGFKLLSPLPYSPDLAPSDYDVFWSLKDSLRGQSFGCDEEVIHTINDWFKLQDKQFLVDGVNSLAHRWEKCVVLDGIILKNCKVNLTIVICVSDFLITYWSTLVHLVVLVTAFMMVSRFGQFLVCSSSTHGAPRAQSFVQNITLKGVKVMWVCIPPTSWWLDIIISTKIIQCIAGIYTTCISYVDYKAANVLRVHSRGVKTNWIKQNNIHCANVTCNVTILLSTITSLVRKSAPIVALYWLENFLFTNWFISDVLPTLHRNKSRNTKQTENERPCKKQVYKTKGGDVSWFSLCAYAHRSTSKILSTLHVYTAKLLAINGSWAQLAPTVLSSTTL